VLYLPENHGGFIHKGAKSPHGDGRTLVLDPGTVELLHIHRALCEASAEAAGTTLSDEAYLFSQEPDGARPVRPEFMTRRFGKLAKSLGHDYTLHGLRHFVATQLGMVAEAGTIRTRMGHGSLAVSSIYVRPTAEADRAAADHMGKVLDS
jgi:integrase